MAIMTLSMALALLSLSGYVAGFAWAVGQSIRQTRAETDARGWHLGNHTFDNMPDVMEWALRYCRDRGYITVTARGSAYAIRFTKYVPRRGAYGIEFSYSTTDGSTGYLPRLRTALTARGIPIRYTRGASILRVDCGQEASKGVELAHLCFFDLFGLPADTRFETKPKRYSSFEESVNDPDVIERTSISEYWKNLEARRRKNEQPIPPIALSLKFAGYGLGFVLCYPILLVALLLSEGAAPDWQIASIGLQGHWNTTILLPIYCGLYAGVKRANRQLDQFRKPRPRRPWARILAGVKTLGPVSAVIASWLGA